MTRSTLLRTAAAATLAFLLLLSPAAFAQGRSSAAQEDGRWLASIWSLLADLFLDGESLDTRCTIDPNGCPDAGASLDTRCGIDPNGGCEPGS